MEVYVYVFSSASFVIQTTDSFIFLLNAFQVLKNLKLLAVFSDLGIEELPLEHNQVNDGPNENLTEGELFNEKAYDLISNTGAETERRTVLHLIYISTIIDISMAYNEA